MATVKVLGHRTSSGLRVCDLPSKLAHSVHFLTGAHPPPLSSPISFGTNVPHSLCLSRAQIFSSSRVLLPGASGHFPCSRPFPKPNHPPITLCPISSHPALLMNLMVTWGCCEGPLGGRMAREGASTLKCGFRAEPPHLLPTLQPLSRPCGASAPRRMPSRQDSQNELVCHEQDVDA